MPTNRRRIAHQDAYIEVNPNPRASRHITRNFGTEDLGYVLQQADGTYLVYTGNHTRPNGKVQENVRVDMPVTSLSKAVDRLLAYYARQDA